MRKNVASYGLLIADLVAIVGCFRAAYWLRFTAATIFPTEGDQAFRLYWAVILLAIGIWILLFHLLEMDRFNEGLGVAVLPRLATAVTLLVTGLLAGSFLARIYYSRLVLAILWLLLLFLLLATRAGYLVALKWLRKYRVGLRRVVVVGDSELAREIADRIQTHHELRYEFAGFLYPTTTRIVDSKLGEMVGGSEGIVRELLNKRVDELIFAIPVSHNTDILDFIAGCQKLGIETKLIPEYYQLHLSQLKSFSVDGIPILELKETTLEWPHRLVKLLMDYAVALGLMLLLSPLFLVIAIVVAVARKGRVIKREVRVGLGSRPFILYRFDVAPGEASQPQLRSFSARVCRFLYRYSLSELPQLWNVIKGDMSLVGPRPETPERIRHYSAWHRRRLSLKPGITGLAQVKGFRGSDPLDEKTKYDLEYAANFSPFLDLSLTLATLGTLLRRRKIAGVAKHARDLAADGTLHPGSL
jgi:exopolysaccharide biosynthesis polyprenyl glycosylphosphotransferase